MQQLLDEKHAVSVAELHFDSYPVDLFSYAKLDPDAVQILQYDFDDDGFGVGKIRNLDPRDPLYLLNENTLMAKTIPLEYQNTPILIDPFCGGYSEGLVMVSTLGEINLQYYHEFSGCAGMWGWLDTDLNVKISPKYIYATNFEGGRAVVCKGE